MKLPSWKSACDKSEVITNHAIMRSVPTRETRSYSVLNEAVGVDVAALSFEACTFNGPFQCTLVLIAISTQSNDSGRPVSPLQAFLKGASLSPGLRAGAELFSPRRGQPALEKFFRAGQKKLLTTAGMRPMVTMRASPKPVV